VRSIDADPRFIDEVCQRTRVQLLVGQPPRLATDGGRGPLRAWVAIAARRVALNAKREVNPEARDDVLLEVVDRARTLLRLRFVEGLELAEIAPLYRVHESTVSRWVTAALEDPQAAHGAAGLER
jgi:RNA polymerase sigma-70 factor, ECF subfamily